MGIMCAAVDARAILPATDGLVAGTPVLTPMGALPVDRLCPGDRIVTRMGMRTLRAIRVEAVPSARMIRIRASALGPDRPEADMIVAPNQQIVLRGVKALTGGRQAVVAVEKLIDGACIRSETMTGFRRYTLEFDAPAIIYAGGLELACQG